MSPVVVLCAGDGRADFADYAVALLALGGVCAETLPISRARFDALPRRIVLAGDLPLTAAEADALKARVAAGARLCAFLPHPHGAARFGFAPTWRTRIGGVAALDGERLPIPGAWRLLTPPSDAQVRASSDDGDPAMVHLRIGDGEAFFWFFDLPRTVSLLRQGDPMRRGLHGNRVAPGWRAADQFAGFQDLAFAHLPVADLLCADLRDRLAAPLPGDSGLPWLWPYPDRAPTVLLLSSDDDWSTPAQFDALDACVRRHGAAVTYYLVADTVVEPAWKTAREALGDTFSIHPDHREPLARTWDETVRAHRDTFRKRFGGEPGPSVRNHAIPWIGYVEGARRDHETGFAWDANFFTCPPDTRHYMAGSGLPAPFVDEIGEVLPVWQLPCHFSDETTLAAGGYDFSLGWTEDEGVEAICGLLAANVRTGASLLCVNTHPVSFATYSGPMWDRVLTEARRLGVPILALERYARFWEARSRVRVGVGAGGGWEVTVPPNDGDLSVAWGERRVTLPTEAGTVTL